ncbi:hypothetical protein K488DRAFT_87570 [Vararia minispora EC-137]|uniref:Uncharacterized protein n=1 Tax=Vararia minispora EC-137 TaxID=1314806 RepID=A0ACB8QFT2_9AGAM|nr:hypothetical protein K488DRAFT_87570 [Vararia minispora EC-137]
MSPTTDPASSQAVAQRNVAGALLAVLFILVGFFLWLFLGRFGKQTRNFSRRLFCCQRRRRTKCAGLPVVAWDTMPAGADSPLDAEKGAQIAVYKQVYILCMSFTPLLYEPHGFLLADLDRALDRLQNAQRAAPLPAPTRSEPSRPHADAQHPAPPPPPLAQPGSGGAHASARDDARVKQRQAAPDPTHASRRLLARCATAILFRGR